MSPSQIVYRSAELAYRAAEDGRPGTLEGRMVPYNEWTEINSKVEGHFMERVLSGALTKTLAERAGRLRVLFDHGFSRMLDNQFIASVDEVDDQETGPIYRASLLSGLPELLMDGLRRGWYGTSIAMRNVKADWIHKPGESDYNPEGLPESSIREASLQEISVVSFPAYEGATASVRSLTDDVMLETHGALIVAKLAREDPDRLLQLVRSELQVEPPHSEPPAEEAPQEEREPEHSPKPTRDYLSDKESEEVWRLP